MEGQAGRAGTAHETTDLGDRPQVAAFFDSWAGFWRDVYDQDDLNGVIYRDRHEVALRWIDQLGQDGPARSLDVGCGAGLLTAALAMRGRPVVAVDPSPSMLTLTRERMGTQRIEAPVSFAVADAHDLGFLTSSFGLVTALGVIPWLHDPVRALEEVRRTLVPGGYVLATADNRWRLSHLVDPRRAPYTERARSALRGALQRRRGLEPAPWSRERRYSPRQVDRFFEQAGFEIVRRASVGFGPLTLLDRNLLSERKGQAVHAWLQRRAGTGARPLAGLLRSLGNHYVVLARAPASARAG